MSVELKPCPFCGGDEVTIGSFGSSCVEPQHYVSCEECDGATVNHVSEGEAIAAWNRRAASEPITDAANDAQDAKRYRFLEYQCRTGTYRGIISREAIDAAMADDIERTDRAGGKA